jgi:sugar lactone lactonase YvrE
VWTDILGNAVFSFDPRGGETVRVDVAATVTALAPRAAGGYVVATERGIGFLELESGRVEQALDVERSTRTRMNDAKVDSAGRFWVGSMAHDMADRGIGRLYCVEPDLSFRTVLDDVTISNGIDWSPDGRTMYYVDSGASSLDTFAFDPESGELHGRRRLAVIAREDGLADGLCVDAEGCAWVAVAYSGEVRRYSPAGELLAAVAVPASIPTSCCFGGDELDELYVTSAAAYVAQPEREPHAGGLFRCRVGVRGRPANSFRG